MADKHPLTFIPGCNTAPDVIREQFKINIEREIPVLEVFQFIHEEHVAIVCGGPSLEKRVDELRDWKGPIIACNGAYKYLLDRDIVADYFMLLDCRKENISFLEEMNRVTLFCIAAQAHPSIFDRLEAYKMQTLMYVTNLPDISELLGDKVKERKYCVLGGVVGTVGIKAMSLAHAMGYRKMHLFGYDSSYDGEEHHAYPQKLNDDVTRIEVFVEDRKYVTSAAFAHQAQEFCIWAKDLIQFHGCEIQLHCGGLLPDLVNYCNRVGESQSLEDREREKYEKIWNIRNYRKFSPGERLVDFAFDKMGMKNGDHIADFGCGTGRAAQKFHVDHKMTVIGIDHANNCLDDGVQIHLYVKNLWDLGLTHKEFHWGYCTDVMEHIPSEKIDAVISNIANTVEKGCFFNIATRDDDMGALIGRKLHMTVANTEAWENVLKRHFQKIETIDKQGEAIFCCWH